METAPLRIANTIRRAWDSPTTVSEPLWETIKGLDELTKKEIAAKHDYAIGAGHHSAIRAEFYRAEGIHTGECELVDEKIAGISVVTGSRISSLAESGDVLVSSTVKDLVAGSGFVFDDRGEHDLKGVPGTWRLYSVTLIHAAFKRHSRTLAHVSQRNNEWRVGSDECSALRGS